MDLEPGLALTFVAVAEEKSFTRAAERMGLLQPQVSVRIRKLERYLGFPVFDRTTRQVLLTERGAKFLPFAEEIARAVRAAQRFAESGVRQRERLALGSVEIAKSFALRNQIINAFANEYPEVDLELRSAENSQLYARLMSGELDALLTFTPLPFEEGKMNVRVLHSMIGKLRVPAECPLAAYNEIPVAALAGAKVLLSPGTICPDVIEALRTQLQSFGITVVRAPEPVAETTMNIASVRRMITFSWGAERPSVRDLGEGMAVRSVEGNPFQIAFCVFTPPGPASPTVRRFIGLAEAIAAGRRGAPTSASPLSAVQAP